MDKLNLKEEFIIDESIKSYEFHEYQPEQIDLNRYNTEYRFKVNQQDLYLDISESYLQFTGQVLRKDNNVEIVLKPEDQLTMINNGLMYLFSSIQYSLSGKEIEDIRNPGETTTIMGYLSYSGDFEKTEGLNQLWYRDGSTDFKTKTSFNVLHKHIVVNSTPNGTFSFLIPLKHILGFCKSYNKVLYGFKHELILNRKSNDHYAIIRTPGDPDTTEGGFIKLSKFSWYIPHVKPNLAKETQILNDIKNKVNYKVAYKRFSSEKQTVPGGKDWSWRLATSTLPDKPRFIIIGFQEVKNEKIDEWDNSKFNHGNLKNVYVNLDSRRYPAIDYDLDFRKNDFCRMFKEAISFNKKCFGITDTVNMTPFDYKDYYPIYVVDVSNQSDEIKGRVTDITIKMSFAKTPQNLEATAIIVTDRIVTFSSDGSKFAVIQ